MTRQEIEKKVDSILGSKTAECDPWSPNVELYQVMHAKSFLKDSCLRDAGFGDAGLSYQNAFFELNKWLWWTLISFIRPVNQPAKYYPESDCWFLLWVSGCINHFVLLLPWPVEN